MIFHKHQAIFFHIGKTAGVSVEKMLCNEDRDFRVADYDNLFGWDKKQKFYLQHATVETTKRLVGRKLFEQYYKFTVVRNPFARLVSVYFYLYDIHQARYGSFHNFIEQLPETIRLKMVQKGSHYISQILYAQLDGENVCDHIAHFEYLPHSLDPVRTHLQLVSKLGHYNSFQCAERGDLAVIEYYTATGIRIVQDLYADDFTLFGYSPDPAREDPLF